MKGLRDRELPVVDAPTQPRTLGNWWCTYGHCEALVAEQECLCCTEWDLLRRDTQETRCVVQCDHTVQQAARFS